MTNGMFAPLYGQLDPLHIGEAAREMSIAGHYGQRLIMRSKNIGIASLNIITSEYPSHGFVIDRREAQALFENVRQPSKDEIDLAEAIGINARWPDWQLNEGPNFSFLSTEVENGEMEK